MLDYTPVLRAELGMMDGTSLGPLRPPAGAAPLSVPAFRRQVTAICHATRVRGKVPATKGRRLEKELGALSGASPTISQVRPVILEMGRWLEGSVYQSSIDEISELAALAPPAKYAATFVATSRSMRSRRNGSSRRRGRSRPVPTERSTTPSIKSKLPLGGASSHGFCRGLGILECGREIESGVPSRSA
ncbi:MAG TPA: hypothetical protein VJL81_12070 [Solirubrobacterales bacterium]|nr:hypothetical protein [Solirubrobacterales bacterium]